MLGEMDGLLSLCVQFVYRSYFTGLPLMTCGPYQHISVESSSIYSRRGIGLSHTLRCCTPAMGRPKAPAMQEFHMRCSAM